MNELYEVGVGLVVLSVFLFILCILIFLSNTFVHSWIFWVVILLFVLIIIGLFLLLIYYQYNTIVPVVEEVIVV